MGLPPLSVKKANNPEKRSGKEKTEYFDLEKYLNSNMRLFNICELMLGNLE